MTSENSPQRLQVVDKFIQERSQPEHFSLAVPESLNFPEISKILEQISELTAGWNPVEIYTASNHNSEKTKFIDSILTTGKADNPHFEYNVAQQMDLSTAQLQLVALKKEAHSLAREIKKETALTAEDKLKFLAALLTVLKINDDLATIDMVQGIKNQDDTFTKTAMSKKYGHLDPALIQEADTIYQNKLHPSEQTLNHTAEQVPPILSPEQQTWLLNQQFDAQQIAQAFTWTLDQYGFLAKNETDFGFQIELTANVTSIDVRDKNPTGKPTIVIPENRTVNGKALLSLIGHEIESHARQSMNGAKLFGLGGGALKIDGEAPYEGLAKQADIKFAQTYFGETTATPEPYYIKAIELAQSGKTFTEVFQIIMQMKEEASHGQLTGEKLAHSAWLTTYRVFRGSTDPENKSAYAMPKDKAYLEGFLIAEQLKELGYDEYNQLAITTGAGLRLLGLFDVNAKDIPYPNLDLQRKYWEEILKPQFEQAQNQK